jgi:zinc D-Ala-D-Ala carboxypeptidase
MGTMRRMKKLLIIVILAVVLVGGFVFVRNNDPAKSNDDSRTSAGFNKDQHSLTDPASPWVIANKKNPLKPKNYYPSDLRAPNVPLRLNAEQEEMQLRDEAAKAVEKMFASATRDGLELMVSSAFRSFDYQDGLYKTYVRTQGQVTADTQSARPGHSEHQTGWAVDVEPASRKCEVEECFADTPEGKWVAANAHKFGFVIRYSKGQQDVTGYVFEPWHLRYVDKALSAEVHKKGNPTLEAFFGLPAAPDYQ